MRDLSVISDGKLAYAHFIGDQTVTDNGGNHNEAVRVTMVLRKVNSSWLIVHEHLAVPYDPATGKAVLDAKPLNARPTKRSDPEEHFDA